MSTTDSKSRRGALSSTVGWVFLSLFYATVNVFIGHRRINLRHGHMDLFDQYESADHNYRGPTATVWGRKEKKVSTAVQRRMDNAATSSIDHDGDILTAILREETPFPVNYNQRIKYKPGMLQVDMVESLQHCSIDPIRYTHHMKSGNSVLVSTSRKHKLIYKTVPKASSSTARTAMEQYFRGEDKRMLLSTLRHNVHEKNFTLVSFVRDPLDRFYSSYDEAFYR